MKSDRHQVLIGAGSSRIDIKEGGRSADKAEAVAALTSIPARVFIHVGDEGQGSLTTRPGDSLKHRGFAVQGIEKIAAVPDATSVRSFNEEDRAAADAIARALKRNNATDAVAQLVTRYKVRPGSTCRPLLRATRFATASTQVQSADYMTSEFAQLDGHN